MSKSNGIFKRGSSHYLRVVLPQTHPLHNEYKSGRVIVSLGASCYRDALTTAAIKRAQILESKERAVRQTNTFANKNSLEVNFLRDIFERWAQSKKRSIDSINSCRRALLLYEEFTGNPPINLLTRADGDGFRSWLQKPERGTSGKTASDRLTWVKSLLKYAYVDLELLARHPWEGINLQSTTETQRRPWSESELQQLFGQELFQEYKLPKEWRAGFDAAYWIPLLGLFSGARISELAQLKISDILVRDGVHVISISDLGSKQQVKTAASVRTIPIHDEVIRLGFLEYAQAIKNEGSESLWPQLRQRHGKPGGIFSNWFGSYRGMIGLTGGPDFHSFRHLVRSELHEAEVSEPIIDSILGHTSKGSVGAKVYTHQKVQALKRAIGKLDFSFINIPKTYRSKIDV